MTPFADVFHLLVDDVVIEAMLDGVVNPCEQLVRQASIVLALSYMGFLGALTPLQAARLRTIGASIDLGATLIPIDPARRRRLLEAVAAGRQAVIRVFDLDEAELPRVAGHQPAGSLN